MPLLDPLHSNESGEEPRQTSVEETPRSCHEDQAARSARDERQADAYAQRHQIGRTAVGDPDWCVACGYGHVDPSLAVRRLAWGHGSPSASRYH